MLNKKAFEVTTQAFQGPLDLLLNLISRHEIDIYDISLAEITDEYLAYIKQMKDLNLDIASEFLLLAATLLEMKSQSLIPNDKIPENFEEMTPDEIRKELTKRLVNYSKFKNAASYLAARLESGGRYHGRTAELEERFLGLIPDFSGEINPQALAAAMVGIIVRKYLAEVNSEHITPITVKIEDQVSLIKNELKSGREFSFKKITRGLPKIETIVTFLAVLELFKNGEVDVIQAKTFGDIQVARVESRESRGRTG